ncbi:MAG: hypothetical protein SPI62_00065 [Candidatus Enteromonas sp.]|nr:hypothetical protein [bacterium]MDD6917583.1 hypothetical protein [bacterium]MDY6100267.1 hypothetical protein [Candidatus Enteromonas sp.]
MNFIPSVLASSSMAPVIVILCLVGFFGLIVLLVILLKKHVPGLKNEEKPKSDKEIAKEELDRLLEKVDDPEAEKSLEEYDAKKKDQNEEGK